MANDCCTTYICVGDKTQINELHDLLKAEYKENSWIYSLVSKYIGEERANKMRLRGEITDFSLENDQLTIVQDTAWCEQEGFREWIEERYPEVTVFYSEEEPGCEIYTTNDISGDYFPDRFVLDVYDGGIEYFRTIKEVASYVSDIVGETIAPTVEAINEATEIYNDAHEDEDKYMYFHEVEVVDE